MFWAVVWLVHSAAASAAEDITLFCYQNKPPYVVDYAAQRGLYFDLAQRLEALMPGYHFAVREIPRRRLDRQLHEGRLPGLVLGVSPAWFANSPAFTLTEPFIDDVNLLVSRNSGEVSRLTLATLQGHRLGLVAGHHYPELTPLLTSGSVSRQDSVDERVNVERLQRGWIDVTVVGKRTLEFFWFERPALQAELFVAEPMSRYQRHLLVPTAYARLVPALNKAIEALDDDEAWQARVAAYR